MAQSKEMMRHNMIVELYELSDFVNQYIPVREIASDTQDVGWNSLLVKIIIIIIRRVRTEIRPHLIPEYSER